MNLEVQHRNPCTLFAIGDRDTLRVPTSDGLGGSCGKRALVEEHLEDMYDGEAELLRESATRLAAFAAGLLAVVATVAVMLLYAAYLQERSCALTGVTAEPAATQCGELKDVKETSIAQEWDAASTLLLATIASTMAFGLAFLAYAVGHVNVDVAGSVSAGALVLCRVALAIASVLVAWAAAKASLASRSALEIVDAVVG